MVNLKPQHSAPLYIYPDITLASMWTVKNNISPSTVSNWPYDLVRISIWRLLRPAAVGPLPEWCPPSLAERSSQSLSYSGAASAPRSTEKNTRGVSNKWEKWRRDSESNERDTWGGLRGWDWERTRCSGWQSHLKSRIQLLLMLYDAYIKNDHVGGLL